MAPASNDNQPHVWLTTRSVEDVQCSVSVGNTTQHATISRDSPIDVTLPEYPPYTVRIGSAGKTNKTIIITSSDDVTVYAIDNIECCGDAFLVLPTEHLGTEYYVVSYAPYSRAFPSFFIATALVEETVVNVLTRTGQAHSVVLKPYESYRFNADEDLTSTRIRSDHPISVTSGVLSRVPVGVESFDGMIVNLLPVNQWGQRFVMAPYLERTCGYVYRVLSSDQSTVRVTISSEAIVLTVDLDAADFYEGNGLGDTMTTITADHPVLVVQYMKGRYACFGDNPLGDPTIVIIPPVESTYTNVTFPVIDTTYYYGRSHEYHFINVIINCDQVDGLMYDGSTLITSWNRLSTVDGSICAIRGQVPTGIHSVVHTNPLATFTVMVYMMHGYHDYAYSFQVGFEPKGGYNFYRFSLISFNSISDWFNYIRFVFW